jgi:hypothetical protein
MTFFTGPFLLTMAELTQVVIGMTIPACRKFYRFTRPVTTVAFNAGNGLMFTLQREPGLVVIKINPGNKLPSGSRMTFGTSGS